VQKEDKAATEAVEGEENFVKAALAQVLGIRGAEAVTDKWKIRLQLTKPVTWVPLIWGEHTEEKAGKHDTPLLQCAHSGMAALTCCWLVSGERQQLLVDNSLIGVCHRAHAW